jgi:predicted TIM-barrel enzyme
MISLPALGLGAVSITAEIIPFVPKRRRSPVVAAVLAIDPPTRDEFLLRL